MAPKLPSFARTVGATMAALRLKEHFDGYKQVDKEEGRVSLQSPSREYHDRETGLQALEEEEGLLDTNIQRPTKKRRSSRCGLNCGLFWKAIGIAAALFFIISAGKLIFWALTPSPTGLEGAPIFSEALGCLDASYLYNGGETTISVPVGDRDDHTVDVHGNGVGTVTITEAPADVTEVQYKLNIKANDRSLLDHIGLQYPAAREDGISDGLSRLLISTPRLKKDASFCVRYDVTMYVPKNVKKLHVLSHAPSHVQFDPHAHLDLDGAFVTLFAVDKRNLIQSTENLRANKLALELVRGWIIGHTSIVMENAFNTQRGDGVINVHVHPIAPTDPLKPDPVSLRTTTGAGRTDVFFVNDKALPHRPIKGFHTSSRNGDVYLNYKEAEFDGNIKMESGAFTVTGAQSYSLGGQTNGQFTHWVGEQDGKDEIYIKSRGYTGLYF